MASDLELLQMEMRLLWGAAAGPAVVVACARDGLRTRFRADVPAEAARRLAAEIASGPPVLEVPPRTERWRVLLENGLQAAVQLAPTSGPSYVVLPHVSFRGTAELIGSDADADRIAALRGANPGNWGAEEWQALLEGQLGPWVMATHGQDVISICHTPVSDSTAAEAGTWTHPDFRGQSHAAATTAAWAALLRTSGRVLFYSTAWSNRASQGVAARLGLRHIGYLWQFQTLGTRRVRRMPQSCA